MFTSRFSGTPLGFIVFALRRRRCGTVRSRNRFKRAPQTPQLEGVSRSELKLDPTLGGFLSGNRQCRFSHVNAEALIVQAGQYTCVLKAVIKSWTRSTMKRLLCADAMSCPHAEQ